MDLDRVVGDELSDLFGPDDPGAAVIVAVDGAAAVRRAFGMADLELGVPMRPELVFRIGSLTKQFTAVAILLLDEVELDEPVVRYLPDYSGPGPDVTVRQLLTHNGGIPSYTSMPAFPDVMDRDVSTQEIIDFIAAEPLDFEPGTKHEYSNSGYMLLGAIIERLSGLSYGDFVARHIFQPLEMERSRYGDMGPLIPGRLRGYERGDGGWRNAGPIGMSWPGAAGGLVSCVDDLLRWDNALYTEDLVSQELLREAWTPARLRNGDPVDYGFGWAITRRDGHVGFEHGGGINGFTSYALRIPERRLFIAVLLNSVGDIAPGVLVDRIYDLIE
ncbi:MAG TPA: serine hydrolase domain-containing protein [Mycobacteriales bacterium]|nr:serine hydrolase domain-containing protein [Mycobacteriales bacterium]